jgi:dolichyl-phosphate beta-glucosyltransferase
LRRERILVIVPAYNEEDILEKNLKKLNDFLQKNFKNNYYLVLVDNASTDNTPYICKNLEKELKNFYYLRTEKKGKGWAIKYATKKFLNKVGYFSFVDADLPFPLDYLTLFYEKIKKCDLVLGNRKFVHIPFIRLITSYGYKLLANFILFFNFKVKDFQAGVMFWNKEIANILIKDVKDNHWFFNTELIYRSIKLNKKICYVNIDYVIEKRSSVKVLKDSLYFLKELIKLKFSEILK